MKSFTFRLKPGQDLFDSIEEIVKQNNFEAGCVLSAVGSLTHATLRLANRNDYTQSGHKLRFFKGGKAQFVTEGIIQ